MIEFLTQLFARYGTAGVFLIAMIEEIIVPIPSALVMMSAGFFLLGTRAFSAGALFELFTRAALPIAAGVTVGSMIVYGLAYRFGRLLVERWGRYLTVTPADMQKMERYFAGGYADEAIVFGLRLLPLIPSVAINIFCGLIHFPPLKYVIITFLGSLPRAFLLGLAGWSLGEVYYRYSAYVSRLEGIGLLVLFVVLFAFFRRRRMMKR